MPSFLDATFILGLLSNLLALFLVCTKSRKELAEYRKLLIIFLVTDLLFTSIQELSKPTVIITGDIFLIFSSGSEKSKWLLALYCGGISLSFFVFAFHFVFRALAISSKFYFITRLDWKKITLICSIFALELAVYTYFCHERFSYEDWYEPDLRAYFDSFGLIFPEDPLNEILIYRAYTPSGSIALHNLFTIFWGVVVSGICFTAIALSSFFVMRYLRNAKMSSDIVRQFHRTIFLSLVVQLSIPCVLLYFPCFVYLVLPYFAPSSLSTPPWLLRSLCSLYPILDPLAIILLISDYRRGIIGMFKSIPTSFKRRHTEVSLY